MHKLSIVRTAFSHQAQQELTRRRRVSGRAEMALIDPASPDIGTLLSHLRDGVEAVILNAREPAARQIARALVGRRGLAAVHVVAHGAPGRVEFSAGAWTSDSLAGDAEALAAIGGSLADDGELRLWSCETAAGEEGAAFVLALAEAAGAEVAASATLVGSAELGGNWSLAALDKHAQAEAPLTPAGVSNYAGVLAAYTWLGNSANWTTTNAWSPTAPTGGPGAGDTVTFAQNTTTAYTCTVNTAVSVTSISISGDNSGTAHASTLTLATGGSIATSGAITLSNNQAFINGVGSINAVGGISGSGTITAGTSTTGGTLDITGTISSGVVLVIGTAAASNLRIESAATSATAISINNAFQTLTVGAAGALTISAAESITNGTIALAGGSLTDASGLTIGSSATLSGYGTAGAVTLSGGTITQNTNALTLTTITGNGTVNGTITNAAITAKGGTLTFSGALAGTASLAIDSSAAATLSVTGTLSSGAIAISNINQTLNIAATGSLTLTAAESITNGKITLAGGTLTDASNLTIGSAATLSGYGTVAANIAAGAGAITASGGTLNLNGTVASGPTFTIATASASNLQFNGAATSTAAISINNGNQTLTVGAAGALTISAAESITNGTLALAGGSLTDASGLTIGSGATLSGYGTAGAVTLSGGTITQNTNALTLTTIIGNGTVNGTITNAAITAKGGTLTFSGALAGTASLAIDSSAAATLSVTGTLSSGAIAISNINQTLNIAATGSLTLTAAESITNGKITLAGGTLTDASNLTIGSAATLSGYGTVAANIAAGAGAITASGGTLNLNGTVASGPTFTIATASASNLQFNAVATSAAAISINNGNQTLTVGAAGALTINAAQTVTSGKIALAGGTLTDSAGIALGSSFTSGTISGFGTVSANVTRGGISGTGTITASGGVLEVTGTIANSGTPLGSLTIGSGATDTLLLDAASYATAASFSGATGTLEIDTAGSLTLTNALAIGANTVKLDGSGVQLTDAGNFTLAGGSISGTGSIAAGNTITGYGTIGASLTGHTGTITASGGTLEISSGFTGVTALAINNTASSRLKLDGTSTATGLTFGTSNGTLEINTAGSLTLTNALAIGANTVQLDGAASALTDSAGLTLTTGTITGRGVITGAISATGAAHITESGGTLELKSAVTNGAGGAIVLTVGATSSDKLLLDASGSSVTTTTFSSATGAGTLELAAGATLTVSGAMSIGSNTVKLDGSGVQLTDAGNFTLAGGSISGTGSIAAGNTITGYGTIGASLTGHTGTITASGGTLEISSGFTGVTALAINNTASSRLKLDGTSTATGLTFGTSNGTLEINTAGSLTLTNALAIGANTVQLDGAASALTDSAGLTLTTGTITGRGVITGAISATGAAHITESGGTLELKNAVTNGAGGAIVLTVGATGSDKLLLDASGSSVTTTTFSNATGAGTLEIAAGATLTVSGAMSIGSNTVKLDGAASTLTDSAGISLTTGAISGLGKVTGPVSASGAAIITASGGTLEINGAITNSGSLALNIGSGATDTLLLDAASAATSAAFSGSTGTLEINTAGSLTLANAFAIGANTLKLDGASSTLTDANGVTLAGGAINGSGALSASTNLSGYGTVNAAFTAADTVTASGGVLEFKSAVDAGAATTFHIANVAGSVLKFDGAVGTASVSPTIIFDGGEGGAGVLDLTGLSGGLASFHATVSGFDEGEGIKIANAASASLNGTASTLTVYDGSNTALGTINLGSTYAGEAFDVSGSVVSVNDLVATLSSNSAAAGMAVSVTGVTDDGAPVTTGLSYQWYLNGSMISGATDSAFTPTNGETGSDLSVTVTQAESWGSESISVDLGAVAGNSNLPTVTVTSAAVQTNQADQTIIGSIAPKGGATVAGAVATIYDNGVSIGTTTVADDNSFSFSVTLPNQGGNSLVVSVDDSLGNPGSSAPLVDVLDNVDPTVTLSNAAGPTNSASQTISGTVTSGGAATVAGETVTLTDDGNFLTTAIVQSNGSFSVGVTLPNQGDNNIVATVNDSFGNPGTSATVDLSLDSIAPTVTITSAAEASNQANQTITGTVTSGGVAAVIGQTVTLYDNTVAIDTTAVQGDGSFTFHVALPNQGGNSLVAKVTDTYGNQGSSAAVDDVLDNVDPAVTLSNAAGPTNSASQTISGTVTSGGAATVVGETVTLTDGGNFLTTAIVQSDGSFSVGVTLPNQGDNNILATVDDSFGNPGMSATVDLSLDSIAPSVTITSAAVQTNQANQTITGTVSSGGVAAIVGQTVTLYDNAVAIGTTAVQGDGSFTFHVALPNQGGNSLVAKVTDTYGNQGSSATVDDLLDSNAPTITFSSSAIATSQANQTIAGTVTSGGSALVVGQTVNLYDNNTLLGSGLVKPDGTFSIAVTLPNQGVNSIVAKVDDSVGNLGTSATLDDALDSTTPTISLTGLVNGAAAANRQLVATVTDPFAPSASEINFSWQLNGNTVASGLGVDTFTPTPLQEGQTLTVSASFADTYGLAESASTSAGTVGQSAAPDHVVVLNLENEGYSAIIGDNAAPYLNFLASQGMLMTNYLGLTHPSQPNYIGLFSGSLQGVSTNTVPSQFPASVPTLASGLADEGLTFGGYAETSTSPVADPQRQPWLEFANSAADARDFSAFPQTATGFANLPTVSFVTPNDNHNMTPQSDNGGGVAAGDAWTQANLSAYAAWAKANNSLLVVTFDENNTNPAVTYPDQIATIIVGDGVPAGVLNNQQANTYSLLASIESLYNVKPIGETATVPIINFYSSTVPSVSTTFTNLPPGITDPSNFPPQNSLAVGPTYVVTGESSRIEWTNRTTNVTTDESLYTLFANEPNFSNTKSLLDSRALYDSATGLYVLSAIVYDVNDAQINIDIATSTDPSKGWTVSELVTGSTSTDMPGLTFGQGNIYISSQVAGGETDNFVVPLAAVTNGATLQAGTNGVTMTPNVNNGSLYGVAGKSGYTYFLAAYSNGDHTNLSYQTYSAAAGQFSATQTVLLSNPDAVSTGNDFVANQAGTSLQLDAGSRKIASVAYSNVGGRDYVYGVSEVQPTGASQPEFQWFELDVTNATDGVTPPAFVQGGDISPASLGFSSDVAIFNPSIAVNAAGDVLINFTASGTSMDPADYYIVAGPNQSFGAPKLYQSSNAPMLVPADDLLYGLVRWGNYSSATADPNNPNGFWISNEYVASGLPNNFGEPSWWSTVTSNVTVSPVVAAPAAPTILTPTNNTLTNHNEPTITGTGVASDTIDVLVDGALIGTTTVAVGGSWSFTPTSPLADGAHIITAKQANSGGTSPASTAVDITVDTQAPSVPTALLDGSVAGGYVNAVNDTSGQTLGGVADAGSTVKVYLNGSATAAFTTTADAVTGAWSVPLGALADGAYSYAATATDAAGNTSPASAAYVFTVDTQAPSVPTALLDGSVAGGYVNAANDTSGQTLGGVADAGSTVKVYLNGSATAAFTTTADAVTGAWSVPLGALADGAYSYAATATDAAGNTSPASAAYVFTVDTQAPSVPTALLDGSVAGGYVNAVNDTSGQTLGGVADAGSTVKVYLNGSATAAFTTTADAVTGAWSVPLGALADGAYSYAATATDAAGNTSPASAAYVFTVDTQAPSVPTALLDGSVAGGYVNAANDTSGQTLGGVADAGSTVKVYLNGSATAAFTTTADAVTGAWSVPLGALADGAYSYAATATDAAGNTSPASAAYVFTVDTQAPSVPTALLDGSVAGGYVNAANDTSGQTLGGVADAGSTVKVYLNGSATAAFTTTADAVTGAWSVPLGALADGAYSYAATATDAAGNTSPASAAYVFTVDTQAPSVPTALLDGSVAGGYVNAVNDTSGQTLGGVADAGSTVKVYLNGSATAAFTTTADAVTGAWSVPLGALADGAYSYAATATDAAGNTSPASAAYVFTVDTQAPSVPTALLDGSVAGGYVNAANDTSGQTLGGVADAGSTVKVYLNGSATAAFTTTADAVTGAWSVPLGALADGAYSYAATATDAAGNTSPASAAYVFTVDTQAPSVPTALLDGSVAGGYVNAVNDTSGQTLGGVADAGSTVKVYLNGSATAAFTTTADAVTGAWSVPLGALADGAYSYAATATDAAGNTSPASAAYVFTVDTQAPSVPTALLDGSVAGGYVNAANDTSGQTLGGVADAGSTVKVYLNGSATAAFTTTADAVTGAWSVPLGALADGAYSYAATATDAAGNTSPASAAYVFTVDTQAPSVPTALLDGSVAGGYVNAVNDTSGQTLGGVADAGSTVKVYLNGSATAAFTTTADAVTGAWSVPLGALADGAYSYAATATDAAGNTSPASAAYVFTVDTQAPSVPTALLDGSVAGGYVNAANDTSGQTLGGVADAGSTVKVYLNGSATAAFTTTADAVTGAWSVPLGALADGAYSYAATATDAAGNTSPASAAYVFTVDTQAPSVPTALLDGSVAGGYVNAVNDTSGQTLGGVADAGSTVKVYLNGSATAAFTTTADAVTGAWSVPLGALADGAYSYAATATDAAGNTSPASAAYVFTVDTQAPSVPTALLDGSVAGGYVNAVNDTSGQTLGGVADAGSTVKVYLNGSATAAFTTTADAVTGAWSVPLGALADGAYSYAATATDAAGNTSPASAAYVFTVDTQAPSVPTALLDGSVAGGYVNAANDTSGQTLGGVADAGSTVKVYLNGSATAAFTTTADAVTGAWSVPLGALADGAYSYAATATDAAGNTSPASAAYVFTVDTQAPSVPTALLDGSVAGGYVNAANDTSGQTLGGVADAGSTVKVYLNGSATAAFTTTADAVTGAWSVPLGALADGAYSYAATATDAAGNTSPASAAYVFTVDTQAPSVPTALLDGSVAGGYVNAANDTSGQTLGGVADAGSTVKVYLNGSATAAFTTTADAVTGAWSVPLGALADGAYSYAATATDAAGNTSPASAAYVFTVDTQAPGAPTVSSATYGSSSWSLTGGGEANATVTIYDGSIVVGSVHAGPSGAWTVPTSETDASVHVLTAVATDAAGNASVASAPVYLGTPNNDIFSFASESALAAAALIIGDGGADTLAITTPATLSDTDFAHVVNVETLALTGASSVTLGIDASNAGLSTVSLGAGDQTITDSNSDALYVDATHMLAANTLTLSGSAAVTINDLTATLAATTLTGALALVGGGNTTFNTGATLSASAWSLTGSGTTATLGVKVNYSGAFSAGAGTQFALSAGGLILNNSTTLAGVVVSSATGHGVALKGATNVSGLTIAGNALVQNYATATQSGGSVTVGDNVVTDRAVLYNSASGIWNITDDSGIARGANAASLLSNVGLLEKTAGSGTSTIAVSVTDTGSVAVNSGTLAFSGPSNSFAGALSGQGKLLFSSGASTLNAGASATVANLGESNSGTTLTVAANVAYAGAFTQGAGSKLVVNSGDTLTLSGTNSLSGATSGAGALTFTGGNSTFNTGATLSASTWSLTGSGTTATLGVQVNYSGAFSAGAGTQLALKAGGLILNNSTTLAGVVVSSATGHGVALKGATNVSGLTIAGNALVQNYATATQSGGSVTVGDNVVTDRAVLYNSASGIWNITDDSGIARGANAASLLSNVGLLEKTAGSGTSTIAVSVTDTGSVAVNSGTLAFSGPSNSFAGALSGQGKLLFSSGASTLNAGASATVANLGESNSGTTLTVAANVAYAGAFTQGAGSKLVVNSGDTLTLSGTNSLSGATSGAGALTFTGGNTTFNTGATLSASAWSLTGSGTTATLGVQVNYSGVFSAGAGTQLALKAGGLILNNSTTLAGVVASSATGHGLALKGTTNVSGLTIAGNALVQNYATATQSGGSVTVGDNVVTDRAVLYNSTSGIWNITDDSGIARGANTASLLSNAGTFEKTSGTGTSTVAPAVANTGVIAVQSGTLDFQAAVTGIGSDTIVNAASLQFDAMVGAGQTIDFTGSDERLYLGAAQSFAGTISGFDVGGATGDAVQLLGNWTFGGFSENGTDTLGTLTLTNGAKHASLLFTGNHSLSSSNLSQAGGVTTIS